MVNQDLSDYVALAKERGVPDDSVAFTLCEQGWSSKKVNAAIAAYYAQKIGQPAPAKTGPSESPGMDMFLYLFSGGMAICWSASLCLLVSELMNGPDQDGYRSGAFGDHVAIFFLSVPLYLLAMVIINRRLRRRVSTLNHWMRHYSTGILLAVGAGSIFAQAVATFMSFINGFDSPEDSARTFLVVVVVAGSLMAYYINWLRWELPSEDANVT